MGSHGRGCVLALDADDRGLAFAASLIYRNKQIIPLSLGRRRLLQFIQSTFQEQIYLRAERAMFAGGQFRKSFLELERHANRKLGHFFSDNFGHVFFVTQINPLDNCVYTGYFGL